MPTYSNSWSNTIPVDGQQAKLLGSDIRQLRLDLFERMNDQLFVDFTTDPLVLKDAIKGAKTGIVRVIPYCAFLNDLHGRENDIVDGSLQGFVSTDLFAPIASYVPHGCTITLMEWLVDKGAATSVDCSIKRKPFASSPGASSSINTTNISASGANIVASPTLAHLVDYTGFTYYLQLHGNGSSTNAFTVYGARVTFNRPLTDNAS